MKFIRSPELICAPFYPRSGQEIIRRLKAAIEATENPNGPGLDQKQVAELIGIPRSTLNEWLHDDQVEPIKRFLAGLERLSDEDRIKFIRSFCRHCPRLEDPRISHDMQAVAVIESLFERGNGITLITGPSDSARTYLATAIGNAFTTRFSKFIVGFDLHPPVHFVPVPGVSYPAADVPPEKLPSLFLRLWCQIAGSKGLMILLNGMWNRISTHQSKVLNLSRNNHILIADDLSAAEGLRKTRRVNVIRIDSTLGKNAPPRFRIHIETS